MQLIKAHNKKSKPVENFKEIETLIPELIAWIDEHNGKILGKYDTGYAFSHAQLSEDPLAVFVVDKSWTLEGAPANMPKDQLFESRVIVNPRIVSAPERTVKYVEDKDPITGHDRTRKIESKNRIRLEEGCMSFPSRPAKKVERFYEVVVEYQIPSSFLGIKRLKRVRKTVKGLKAHIFQHECDHMQGKNIFYGNRTR